MANLTESAVWEDGIYQFEEEDLVQGGADGIDNVQAKQLANRTSYLKSLFEGMNLTAFARTLIAAADAAAARGLLGAVTQADINAAIAALVNSSPAALDTLNEFAAALGNDANFSTTITNAIATKAPLASPVLTGNPTAPTPAQFDNDTRLATTAFVRSELLGLGNSAYDAIFGKSLATNGYQKLPGGLIIQWGLSGLTSTSLPVTFPIAFPNAVFRVLENDFGVPTEKTIWSTENIAATGFTAYPIGRLIKGNASFYPSAGAAFPWLAIGH